MPKRDMRHSRLVMFHNKLLIRPLLIVKTARKGGLHFAKENLMDTQEKDPILGEEGQLILSKLLAMKPERRALAEAMIEALFQAEILEQSVDIAIDTQQAAAVVLGLVDA